MSVLRRRTKLILLACAVAVASASAWFGSRYFQQGSLALHARLAYADGSAQSIAGETFFILSADPLRLALDEENERSGGGDFDTEGQSNLRTLAGALAARRWHASPLGAEIAVLVRESRPLWEQRVVGSARTDARGRAVFSNLSPGDYWLMGLAETRDGVAYWNRRVSIARGRNEVELYPDNSLQCSGCATSAWAAAHERTPLAR